MNIINKRKNMNNLKKIGLSALAGSLVAFSASAVEMSVSGTAEVTYSTVEGTGVNQISAGNPWGSNTSLLFTGSGDVGFGTATIRRSLNDGGGNGTYLLKMEPNAKSLPHVHTGFEEFLMLEGELTDPDNKVFKKGDFVTFEPGSTHSSFTKDGCLILVFMRGINKPL